MKKIVATVALISALMSPAFAGDDAGFQAAALKCWNAPSGVETRKHFVMSVEIDARGELVDMTAKEYEKGEQHRAVGQSLQRAIMRCAPYKFPAGVYTITIDKGSFGGKSLNIWKD